MKTLTCFLALVGLLAITGCSTPRGGTADDEYYNDTGSVRSSRDMDSHWATSPMRDTSQPIPPP
ncbi:MAG TPA: hypothetical protein VK327_03285 [Candidatus Paceibacterota bacterium]|nr:hypothetical protein [Candidatus Paceibacterota bacterium]